MLACHYLIKNWWLLHRGFKLFCLWVFTDWCCTNTTTTKHISYSAADTRMETVAKNHSTHVHTHLTESLSVCVNLKTQTSRKYSDGKKVALLTLHPCLLLLSLCPPDHLFLLLLMLKHPQWCEAFCVSRLQRVSGESEEERGSISRGNKSGLIGAWETCLFSCLFSFPIPFHFFFPASHSRSVHLRRTSRESKED